eukprot:2584726-Amphidinium_carterae.1
MAMLPKRSHRRSSGLAMGRTPTYVEESDVVVMRLLQKAASDGNILKVWFAVFDRGHTLRTNYERFAEGMRSLHFTGSVPGIWEELDEEECHELSLCQIDHEASNLWSEFRRWCGATFSGAKEMLRALKAASRRRDSDASHFSEEVFAPLLEPPDGHRPRASYLGVARPPPQRRSVTAPAQSADRYHMDELVVEDEFVRALPKLGWNSGSEA